MNSINYIILPNPPTKIFDKSSHSISFGILLSSWLKRIWYFFSKLITVLRFLPIVFDLERANQLSLLPDKDLADLCPLIEPYQVTKNLNTHFPNHWRTYRKFGLKPRRFTTALSYNGKSDNQAKNWTLTTDSRGFRSEKTSNSALNE